MKGRPALWAALLAGAAAAALAGFTSFSADEAVYARIDIDKIGPEALAALTAELRPEWTVEADQQLLVLTTRAALASVKRPYQVLPVAPEPESLFVIREAHDSILMNLESDVLVKGGRHAVVQARTAYLKNILAHPSVQPFQPNLVLARQVANEGPGDPVNFTDDATRLVASVDGELWLRNLTTLSSTNRYSHGTGIATSRDWLVAQLRAMPNLEVTTEAFRVGSTTAYNVIAKLTGTTRPDDWYIVGAHYDSTSQSPSSAAPGAEDNGSGTAGVLELARLFTAERPAATVYFILFAGEEQGLVGSYAYARKLVADGHKAKVKAVLTMDMIGYTGDTDLDCLLESDALGDRTLFNLMKAAAARFTTMRMVTSLNPWGSDHVPFIEQGIPSVLTIENDWDDYPAYHRTNDKVENITLAMAVETLKMKVATLAQLALD